MDPLAAAVSRGRSLTLSQKADIRWFISQNVFSETSLLFFLQYLDRCWRLNATCFVYSLILWRCFSLVFCIVKLVIKCVPALSGTVAKVLRWCISELDESSPHPNLIYLIPVSLSSYNLRLGRLSDLFCLGFPTKVLYLFLVATCERQDFTPIKRNSKIIVLYISIVTFVDSRAEYKILWADVSLLFVTKYFKVLLLFSFSCILVTRREHVLSFLCGYIIPLL